MNKVFKVIWNHATQSWVAVSELASAKGKTKSKTSTLTALSVVVGSAMVAGSALAAVSTTVTSTTIDQQAGATISGTTTGVFHLANVTTTVVKSDGSATPTNVIVIGNRTDNVFDSQVLIGYNITSIAYGKAGDTVVGNRVQLGGGSNGNDSFSTAVGFGTQVAGPSVAIGVGARSDILDSTGWNATSNAGVAIGAFALQGGNINGGTVIGGLSSGDYHYATSIGALSGITNTFVDKATNTGYALLEGGGATNARVAQTSVGYKAGARGARSVAIANCATTGVANTNAGIGAVAIGDQSKAFKDASIAIGQQAIAGGVTSAEITALNTEVARIQGLLDTANATLATAITNMNADPSADNKFNVASAQAAVQRISLALERAKKDLTYASANNSQTTAAVAIGYAAKSNNFYSTAVGPQSIANSANSTALGRSANVSGANASSALAIGHDARVIGDKAVNATAIGTASRIQHNASGAIAFGSNSNIYGDSNNSIAIGTNANISNIYRRASGVYAVAENATVLGAFSTASANKSTAVGSNNTVIGASSGAVGSDNIVGAYSSGIDTSTYNGTRSFVVGSNNTVTLANDTMVFGNNVAVTQANRSGSVILGNDSSVPENVTAINSAKVGNVTYAGFAGNLGGTTTDGTSAVAADQGRFVSIGNATAPRQIKHVAAGRIEADSTDAINGSQLYYLTGVVSNMGVSVANVIGGNAVLNPNGTVSGFSQPLNTTALGNKEDYTAPTTPATNVSTAITNLNNYVNAGWKIAEGNDIDAKARISPNEQVNFKANGLATVSVEANGTGGADVTYSVKKGTFDTTTNGTVKANSTEGVVTNTDVATAVNNSGWNTTTSDGTNVTVNPGDQVNYVNGNGTKANVTTTTVNGKDVVSVSYDVNTTTGTINTNGSVAVTDGNSFLNASAVANLVNNAAFNVTTAKVDAFVTNQEGKANATVKAGGNITYTAGKNIAIKQDGSNFTFATEQNVTFTNANVTSTLAIGNASSTSSPVVNIKTENATTANVNNATTSPTAALNITSADGNATQIKGVASSLNTTTVTTFPDGTTDPTDTTTATSKQLLNLGTDDAPLSDSVLNSVVTVRDLTNLGWVVSANGNNYTDTVKNANEVKFNGVNGITVTGNTTNGVRNINISLNTTNITSNANGTSSVTNGDSYVNASTVSDAINKAGWNTTTSDGTNVTVNPGDQVNYVNGNGTKANVTTTTVNGKDVVSVSYDVNTTTGTINTNGSVAVTDGNSFLNASAVANLVNNAAFNVTTAKVDAFVTNQEGKANATVKAGGNITYTAGKNIAIKQDGSNFTFATEQNVTFTNANVTSTLAIGNASSTSSPVVNIKTENATTANVNNATTSPTAALNITSADGNATQIKGVASSLNTTTVTTFPDGTTDPTDTTTATSKQLLNLGTDDAPLSDSVLNSVVTVRDLTNLGWVVSANGNNYTDTVKNANEVKFNGVNGITVTGNTTNGVRNINISLNTTNITSNANGTSSVTNGDSYVNASTVSDAINKAGWNTTTSDGTNVTVNPGDTVNYVNSSTATANVTVSKDANGKDVVNVTYDVNTGSITAADSNATITVTNDDGTTSTVANPDRGKVTVEDGQGDKVATVQNVADAINSAKWIASVEETNEEIATSTADDAGVGVGAGDELSFKAGKNLKIKRDGQNITYALANDINVTTVTATGNITVGTGDNATTINQGSITNLNDHLTAPTANSTSPVTNATSTTAPTLTNAEKKQAATVNDVLNAGWNLQANDNAVDAVTHGNTVNFVSTDGSVTITPTTDGSTSKLDFSVNATSIVTNAAGNVSANATTGKAVVGANGVANTTTGYANKVATVGDVANTINNTGWLTNVTDANGNVTTKVVTPGTQVNYVNGNGTTANVVANSTTGGLDVTFNVSQNKAGTQNANGTVTLADAANGTSTFLNAQDTVNLINSASFNVTTAKVDSFVTNQEGKENKAVKAGETITYTAGKNIAIKQDSANFTFATEQNVTFTNANVTGTLSVGAGNTTSPVVNITTGTGEHNNNGTTTSPSTVNMGNAQLTNVSAGANVYGQVVDANGRPLTAVTTRDASGNAVTNYYAADQFTASGALIDGATSSTPVTTSNVAKAVSGLADLASSNATNVMTVADAKNLGWVVSTSDNDYADKVQNANQVNFKAEANTGVTVKGATNATTGVREVVVGNDYFKANATAGSTAANAAGSNSVAVGPNSVANTAGSVAIGNGANVTTSAPAGSVAIGQGATAGAVNTGAYRIDGSTDVAGAPNATTRVFSVGNASSPSQIQNVAAGVVSATSTDAVNGSQLHATNQAVINNARAIGHLDHKIDQVDKRGRKGTAIAGAIGMLPQPHISGKSMVSAATTNYRGEQAIAVGYSRLSDNGKHIIKLSGSSNVAGKKDAMVGAAYGYQW